jgi:hypothetical protein
MVIGAPVVTGAVQISAIPGPASASPRRTREVQVQPPPDGVAVLGPGASSKLTHKTSREPSAGVKLALTSEPATATPAENLATEVFTLIPMPSLAFAYSGWFQSAEAVVPSGGVNGARRGAGAAEYSTPATSYRMAA